MKESALSAKIIKMINGIQGCHAQKLHGSQFTTAGTPDIFASIQGQALFLEVKTPTGQVSPVQHVELDRWARAGAIVAVVVSEISALEAVKLAIQHRIQTRMLQHLPSIEAAGSEEAESAIDAVVKSANDFVQSIEDSEEIESVTLTSDEKSVTIGGE